MAEIVPDWERELLEKETARKAHAAALRAAEDVLCAYELGALGTIEGRYLADTLRMVLAATRAFPDHG